MEALLVRVSEAAKALAISRSKLYEMIASQQIPAIRIDKALRIPVDALHEWLLAHTDTR